MTRENVGYLTVEQALGNQIWFATHFTADYASLLTTLKMSYGIPNSPVIAFGGSYGGMLSAWFRMKYPNVCKGAISASAPIKMGTGGVDYVANPRYFETVTNDFKKYNPACPGKTKI